MSRARTAAVAVAAVLLVAVGLIQLVRAEARSTSTDVNVDGVPVRLVRPVRDTPDRMPAVVVAHGFAGSGRLMAGFGDTLVNSGYLVALLDFTGHGANPAGRPDDPTEAAAALRHDLEVVVRHVRGLSDVDPERVGLVGHSMGASAVVDYAARDQRIRATVAISLGAEDFGTPRELLVLYGGLEFPGFADAAAKAERTGVARRVVEVPMVEHISVLFATRTHIEVVNWLAAGLGGGTGAVAPRARLLPALLILVGLVLGMVPLAGVLRGGPPPPARPVAWWWAPVAVAVAVVAGRLFAWLPLAVGGYTFGFFLAAGAVLFAAAGRPTRPAGCRWAPLFIAYAAAAVFLPVHLGLTHAVPVGARWWLLPVMMLGCGLYLFAAERAAAGHAGRHALMLALTAGGLLSGAVIGVAPGFVVLIVPLLVALLAWHAIWAAVLRGRGAPGWLIASVGAVVLAWPMATTLPLTV